ncbi:ADP-ribosyl-[dinitrogen reductase] hydrolase [Azoarcus sp. CIB]|uniref:ADP-ribosyl-[dinitrogen reductase] hydrolase n=1 Tax=Aromatoleum sp. (strain CIB) TaxID=198107 RepID=UPI00067D3DF3|nr:ADP-ribosyl-[dinitrogen reductase] hydrolase [Azoarcus sp. CIB]AKU10614.1 ADP-ribosyl-[dinitrogen reductase] hydrolase [Azoarcus sp. CIB]
MTNATEPTLRERALGAYLGLAVGDALGATVEFLTPSEIRHQYGELRDIVGGGWLRLKAGQVTDDTQMSLALGAAIIESGGWDLKNIAEHWLAWLKSKPIDVGNTCRRGLVRFGRDGSLESPFSDGDAGNGALMRVLPAILFAYRDMALLERCALEQAHVTHNHPLSDAATLCLARMLADLLHGGHWRDNLAKLRAHAKALVDAHRQFRFDPYPKRATGYVVDTAQTVLYAFFSTDDFESCLIRTVNCGGDADTTGAIAGMLAGAHYGVDAIPVRWLKRLDRDVSEAIVRQVDGLLALGSA